MPSSSCSSGRSSRGAISSNPNASVAMAVEHIVTRMAFELPDLPYSFDALEPHIDALTMEIHHDRHHKAYVDNANKAIAGNAALEGKPLEALIGDLASVPDNIRGPVRNN